MNLLKAIYISLFVTYLVVATQYAATEVTRGMQPIESWLGLLLAVVAPLLFFVYVFVRKPPRTSPHPLGVSMASGLGVAVTMAMSWRFDDAVGFVHVWAGLGFLGWIIYLRWYSTFPGRNASELAVGVPLPRFELENLAGETVSSESFIGSPHVLLFYRGNWCPFCTAQIQELAENYQALSQAGAVCIMVSSQSASRSQALARKFDIPMRFLRDPGNRAARQLGILARWGTPMGLQALGYGSDTAMPTVVISNSSGNIVYSHQTDNYRVRPEPDQFLKILKETCR